MAGEKREIRKRQQAMNRWSRLGIQLVFFILAPATFSMGFSGAKYLFSQLGQGKAIEATSFVILFVGLCVLTVVFARFFCGYVCAFGTLGDVIYQAVDAVLKRLGRTRKPMAPALEAKLRYVKFVVLVGILVAVFLGAGQVVNANSPWTAFGRAINFTFMEMSIIGTVLLVLIMVGMGWKERFFCEFLCPLGAIFALLPVLPFANMRRHMGVCDGCGTCARNCPVGIYPPGEGAHMGECISCGRCVNVCPQGCIAQTTLARLEAQMGVAQNVGEGEAPSEQNLKALRAASREAALAQSPVKRTRLVRSIVLAVVFLAFFWLLGAVSYLPTPGVM